MTWQCSVGLLTQAKSSCARSLTATQKLRGKKGHEKSPENTNMKMQKDSPFIFPYLCQGKKETETKCGKIIFKTFSQLLFAIYTFKIHSKFKTLLNLWCLLKWKFLSFYFTFTFCFRISES